jgi:predicted membrane protein
MHQKNTAKILWGILLIVVALTLGLQALDVSFGSGALSAFPIWKLILSVILLVCAIRELCKLHYSGFFFPLAVIVMLLNRELAALLHLPRERVASAWLLLLIALLFSMGMEMLLPGRRLRKKAIKINAEDDEDETDDEDEADGEDSHVEKGNHCSARLGEKTLYVDVTTPLHVDVEVHLGSATVYFTNCEQYTGGGVVQIENHLGSVTLHVPSDWFVEDRLDNSLGSVTIPYSACADPQKTLLLTGENHIGNVDVEYFHP